MLGQFLTLLGGDKIDCLKEKRKGDAVVDGGQDEEVDRHPSKHPH